MYKALLKKAKNGLSKLIVQQEDVVGVDIMPGYIRIAQLEQQGGDWTLSRLAYRYVEEQLETNDLQNNPDNYATKLRQVLEKNKISTSNAAISIPVSSAIIRVINLPLMTDDELQEAVNTESLWENVVELPDDWAEYSIFHQVIKRHNNENMMDLLFVASKLTDIEYYLNLARQAGLNPVVIDVRCFSLRNALSLKKGLDFKQPIALLEFGPYENYLLILHEEAPFIAEIYISEQDKEKYLQLSSSSLADDSSRKMHDRYGMQVLQVISSYEAKYNTRIARIFVVSTLPAISDAVDQLRTSLPNTTLEEFNPLSDVRVPENVAKKVKAEPNVSMFAPVLGLATRKLDIFGYYQYVTGVNNINLLPNRDQVRAKEKTRLFAKWSLFLVSILLLGIAGWSFFDVYDEQRAIDAKMNDYYTLASERDQKQIKLDELDMQIGEFFGLLELTSDLHSNQAFMYAVLMHINNSVIEDGIALKSITYSDGVINIVGHSLNDHNIIEFNSRLDKSSLITRASLLTMSVIKENELVLKAFSLRCELGDERQELGSK